MTQYDATSSSSTARSGRMVQFQQIAREEIKKGTYLVGSLRNDGKVAIAQQVEAETGGKPIHIFLKGAIELEDKTRLRAVRKVIDELIRFFEDEGLLEPEI